MSSGNGLKLVHRAEETYTQLLGTAREFTHNLGLDYEKSIPRLGRTSAESREAEPIQPVGLVVEPERSVSARIFKN